MTYCKLSNSFETDLECFSFLTFSSSFNSLKGAMVLKYDFCEKRFLEKLDS